MYRSNMRRIAWNDPFYAHPKPAFGSDVSTFTPKVETRPEFTPDEHAVTRQVSITEADIVKKTESSTGNTRNPTHDISINVKQQVVKNIVAHAFGRFVDNEKVNGNAVLEKAGVFLVSEGVDDMRPLPDSFYQMKHSHVLARTAYDVVLNSLLEMRKPTLMDVVMFAVAETAATAIVKGH